MGKKSPCPQKRACAVHRFSPPCAHPIKIQTYVADFSPFVEFVDYKLPNLLYAQEWCYSSISLS